MTPMLDIVFIMLIFFIVTATFVKESGLDVTRPDAETAVKQSRVGILIAIGENNEIYINRREVDLAPCAPMLSACTRKTRKAVR